MALGVWMLLRLARWGAPGRFRPLRGQLRHELGKWCVAIVTAAALVNAYRGAPRGARSSEQPRAYGPTPLNEGST